MELADFWADPRQVAAQDHAVDQFETVHAAAGVGMIRVLQPHRVEPAGPELWISVGLDRGDDSLLDIGGQPAGAKFRQRGLPAQTRGIVAL